MTVTDAARSPTLPITVPKHTLTSQRPSGERQSPSAAVANQRLPRLGAYDTVRFETSCALKAADRDTGFRPIVTVNRQVVPDSAQGALKVSNILACQWRPLGRKLPGETKGRPGSTECDIGSGTDDPVRRQSMGPLKAPDRGCGCWAKPTIDANPDAMPAQQLLKLDHTWSLRHRMSKL